MITENKILLYQDRITGEKQPITADIYLTEYCNNSCEYCRFGKRTGRWMSYNLFVQVYRRLCELGVRGFILTGGGEPTVNPDFDAITRFLEIEGAAYGINTNFNVYRESKPVFIKISIDEGCREKYKQMRGVDKLLTVTENIKRYRAFVETEKANTRIGIQCVTKDVEQIRRFYEFSKENLWRYVDYIQFRPIEKKGENLDYTAILAELEKLQKVDDKIYISYKFNYVNFQPQKCIANWVSITVGTDGMVHYCCNRPGLIVGSVFDDNILPEKQRFCVDMRQCERPCRLTGANISLFDRIEDKEIYFV